MSFPMQSPDPSAPTGELAYVGGTDYVLPQLGRRPIAFTGSEIAMAMSFTPELPYWYEINLYRSRDGQFFLAIRKFYQSESEEDMVKSWTFPTLEHAFEHLEGYDAADDLAVPHLDYAAMAPLEMSATALGLQSQIEQARSHFAGLVGQILFEIDAAESALAA